MGPGGLERVRAAVRTRDGRGSGGKMSNSRGRQTCLRWFRSWGLWSGADQAGCKLVPFSAILNGRHGLPVPLPVPQSR